MTRKHDIAIIGIGGVFPDAKDAQTFWNNILDGHVAIREVTDDRWESDLFFSEDRNHPDKTYSKIGGFIGAPPFDRKTFRIAPKVVEQMDDVQKLALTSVFQALEDAGLEAAPGSGKGRAFDRSETAVILGNSMGGKREDKTNFRVFYPKAKEALMEASGFRGLPEAEQTKLLEEFEEAYKAWTPPITEDSMPGELSNCIAGRVANALDLCGPNFTTDAACAASMAALTSAVQGLRQGAYDMAIAGGFDLTMDAPSYVKFSKIGALSAEHSRPFDAQANGFVMGEGGGVLVLKRLEDAERDGDRIYAKVLGVGAASDGRGKGLTAPNPRGQRLSLERAYKDADVSIESIGLFEAHGTSTKVGDAVELGVLTELLEAHSEPRQIPVGSVKSMIGHLKSAAGAASLIKTTMALHTKRLPPSAGYDEAPLNSPLSKGYLKVNSHARSWTSHDASTPLRAGVSAFGFGGTNFHAVLEEYRPEVASLASVGLDSQAKTTSTREPSMNTQGAKGPANTMTNYSETIFSIFQNATGYERDELEPELELEAELGIDTVKQAEILGQIRTEFGLPEEQEFNLADLSTIASIITLVERHHPATGAVDETKPAVEPRTETNNAGPILIRVHGADREEIGQSIRRALKAQDQRSALEQLSSDTRGSIRLAFVSTLRDVEARLEDALTKSPRRLAAQGIFWGEGNEAQKVAFLFPGQGSQYVGMMQSLAEKSVGVAEVFERGEEALKPLINGSLKDIVWGDREDPAIAGRLRQTEICQPAMLTADIAMMRWLNDAGLTPDWVAGHSLGEYAACVAAGVMDFEDALHAVSARGKEMAAVDVPDCGKMATVAAGVNVVEEHLRKIDGYVVAANQNCHAQTVIAGATDAVERAVAHFQENGIDSREIPVSHAFHSEIVAPAAQPLKKVLDQLNLRAAHLPICSNVGALEYPETSSEISALLAKQMASPVEFIRQVEKLYEHGVRIFVEVGPRRAITGFVRNILDKRPHTAIHTNHHKRGDLEGALDALAAVFAAGGMIPTQGDTADSQVKSQMSSSSLSRSQPSTISGLAVLMPKQDTVEPVDGDWFETIRRGQNFIQSVPQDRLENVVDKKIERLEKSSGRFSAINTLDDVFKLAGQTGDFNIEETYGVHEAMAGVLDRTSQLAIAAGIDAIRDAGLPLVQRFRETKSGRKLANGWALPESVGRDTGVIFASAFPGIDRLIDEVSQASRVQVIRDVVESLKDAEKGELVAALEEHLSTSGIAQDYQFSRKFLFRILSMGHTQMAQHIGALGPNTQLNAACASGSQAIAIATDWISAGRCKRVLVISADDVVYKKNLEWIGSGFLASGAATTSGVVEDAAVPFGKSRNGMILGSGAAAFVVEAGSLCAERGLRPLSRVVATHIGNSAFHATRLEPNTIREAFRGVTDALSEYSGLSRAELAQELVFMSHETYTPARGGSSAAEVDALRYAFESAAPNVLIANTKGFTGHPMGATLEDAVLMKALQRGYCPPVANLSEVDPEFADLNLSRGQEMDRRFGIRFAAGFGSQMVLVAYERDATGEARLVDEALYESWATSVSGAQKTSFKLEQRTLKLVSDDSGAKVSELGIPGLSPVEPVIAPPQTVVAETMQSTPMSVEVGSIPSAEIILQDVKSRVAMATGYELDELDPNLELEAELGIDTVKQAEILGELREAYALPESTTFELSALKTLNDIVAMLTTQGVSFDDNSEAQATSHQVTQAPGSTLERITELVASATGYEIDELDPTLELEAELGIDTVKQAELLGALREEFRIGEDVEARIAELSTLEALAVFVNQHRQDAADVVPVVSEHRVEEQISAPRPSKVEGVAMLILIQEMVAEATGYTIDELEPDLELEAELGIDTVKQAELMGAIKERFGIEDDVEVELASLSTLSKLAAWVDQNSGSLTTVGGEVSPEPTETVISVDLLDVVTQVLASETGYETAELDPTLMLEADLGIDTVKQAEVMGILREKFNLSQDESLDLSELSTIEKIVFYLTTRLGTEPSPPDGGLGSFGPFHPRRVHAFPLATDAPSPSLLSERVVLTGRATPTMMKAGKIIEEFGASVTRAPLAEISAKHFEGTHSLLIYVEPRRESLEELFVWLTERGNVLQSSHVQHLGLMLAVSTEPSAEDWVVEAGLQAMAKSLAKEWPSLAVKCVSVQAGDQDIASLRKALGLIWSPHPGVTYGLSTSGAVRRGISSELSELRPKFRPDLVVATGGTSGVTYEIVASLAMKASIKKLMLVGRTAPCAPHESALYGLDLVGRKALAKERIEASGHRATPVEVKRWIEREERRIQIHERLENLRLTGAEVEFVNCDVSNPSELASMIQALRDAQQPVDLLIHGAGVEISRPTGSKTLADWNLTLNAKVKAAETILSALKPTRTILMGSVAGRFGNAMQTDYAAANAMLAALAEQYENTLCVDWTAWAGTGMATRGSTSAVLEKAGVEFLPLELGASVGAALALSSEVGEVLVAGELGRFEDLDPCSVAHRETETVHPQWCFEVDPRQSRGLKDHAINGTPVLPGVVGIEWMLRHAEAVLGQPVSVVEDVSFHAPLKFFGMEPVEITIGAEPTKNRELTVSLSSVRTLKNGRVQNKRHFSMRALVGDVESASSILPQIDVNRSIGSEDIYQRYFHGETFQVLDRADSCQTGELRAPMKRCGAWFDDSSIDVQRSDAQAHEAMFQLAGLAEMLSAKSMGLPSSIQRLTVHESGKITSVVCRERADKEGWDLLGVDSQGLVLSEMSGYQSATLRPLEESEWFVQSLETVEIQRKRVDEVVEAALSHHELGAHDALSAKEREIFSGLKTEKRKQEWFAGRLVSKTMLSKYLARQGENVELKDISLIPDTLGRPRVAVNGQIRGDVSVSISHSAGWVVVVVDGELESVGIDIEEVSERHPSWSRQFFTEGERQEAEAWAGGAAEYLTSAWAVKEAYMKAIGTGARFDFRELEVLRDGDAWRLALKDEAKRWAGAFASKRPQVSVERRPEWVEAIVRFKDGEEVTSV